MKVAVMGAGAVGCFFGGMLARAGHDVVLIGRPQHVEAIARDGLRLEARQFDERIGAPHLTASTEASAVAGAELVPPPPHPVVSTPKLRMRAGLKMEKRDRMV